MLINFLFTHKKTPADIAKKRLQVIISERKIKNHHNIHQLSQLKNDLLQVICKYTYDPKILSFKLIQKDKNTLILKCDFSLINKKYKDNI